MKTNWQLTFMCHENTMERPWKFKENFNFYIFTGYSRVMICCNPLKTSELWHHEILGLKFMGFSVPLKRPWNAIFMGISWLLGHFTQYFMGHEYENFHRFFMGFFRSFSWHWDHENVIDLTMKILWKICEFTMNYFTRFSWVLSS